SPGPPPWSRKAAGAPRPSRSVRRPGSRSCHHPPPLNADAVEFLCRLLARPAPLRRGPRGGRRLGVEAGGEARRPPPQGPPPGRGALLRVRPAPADRAASHPAPPPARPGDAAADPAKDAAKGDGPPATTGRQPACGLI